MSKVRRPVGKDHPLVDPVRMADSLEDLLYNGEFDFVERLLDRMVTDELPVDTLKAVLRETCHVAGDLRAAHFNFEARARKSLTETWHMPVDELEAFFKTLE